MERGNHYLWQWGGMTEGRIACISLNICLCLVINSSPNHSDFCFFIYIACWRLFRSGFVLSAQLHLALVHVLPVLEAAALGAVLILLPQGKRVLSQTY